MKILYAIQGTGNGHLSRAKAIIPYLLDHGELDLLLSGQQADITLDYPIKYKYKGLSFFFGKNGGIDFVKSYKKNSLFNFFKEVCHCPVSSYDLIINDFEPVTAWASKLRGANCISLSHQSALLGKCVPKPKHRDFVGYLLLKYFAPSSKAYGFHFKAYNNSTYTPIIRNGIRQRKIKNLKHYTVYLPAYSDKKIITVLSNFKSVNWKVFSKHATNTYRKDNIIVIPIKLGGFEDSITTSEGVLCGAGFETPAEALFLKKKLLVVPMKNQYEQHYNASALKELGVTVIKNLKKKQLKKIDAWLASNHHIEINYKDETSSVVNHIVLEHLSKPKNNKTIPILQ